MELIKVIKVSVWFACTIFVDLGERVANSSNGMLNMVSITHYPPGFLSRRILARPDLWRPFEIQPARAIGDLR